MLRTLQQALEQLYGLERRRDKLGLDGTRALLAALGNPERAFRAVHVAGTNGKGSVCAYIERVLRALRTRTGLFTSPHLADFRERIRVEGRWADEERLFELLERIEALPGAPDRTFFEVATALGFAWFAAEGVEWAVVEVGLGGRLDTTNVLAPNLTVITGIGLDHTEILGDTIEAIAAEKAGIVKPGVPVVTGAHLDARAMGVIRAIAAERGAPLVATRDVGAGGWAEWLAGFDAPWGGAPLRFAPASPMAARNAATALTALAVLHRHGLALSPEAVERGLSQARWPGRFERSPNPRLWWDGAHNAEGATALAASWRAAQLPPPAALVLALSRDKDAAAFVAALAELAPQAEVVATRTRNERALEPERIATLARERGLAASLAADVPSACGQALAIAARHDPQALVLLTGSLFAVGEAMEALGGAPGAEL